jgi:hypothetical protein
VPSTTSGAPTRAAGASSRPRSTPSTGLTARALGATLYTADADYDAIREVLDFELQRVPS